MKLPIYLLIDTSESMTGEPLESVISGLHMLDSALRSNPQALETAYLSVITFGNEAKRIVPLTEIESFQIPPISTGGRTSLGQALELLCRLRDEEVEPHDWMPLVFILCGSMPTDDLKRGVEEFHKRKWGAAVSFITGDDVDGNLFESITPASVIHGTESTKTLMSFFRWVSQDSTDKSPKSRNSLNRTDCEFGSSGSEVVAVKAESGQTYEYVKTCTPKTDALKEVYFSPDRSYGVAFFKQRPDQNGIERLRLLVGRYRQEIFMQEGEDYWRKVFCWPSDLITEGDRVGLVVPAYPNQFFFSHDGDCMCPKHGEEKNSYWYMNPWNHFRNVSKEEIGDWRSFFKISLELARGVGRLHAAGFAHTDLSNNNVLVDPVTSSVLITGLDGIIVPGKNPPEVIGTPGFIAPEVIATLSLPRGDPRKKEPCQETDLHALAVLIYEFLLCRDPLDGPKVWDFDDEDNDQMLAMGENAIFIEDPRDRQNRYDIEWVRRNEEPSRLPYCLPWLDLDNLPYTVLGPHLSRLIERAFVEGLHNPEKRPGASDWEEALAQTLDLLIPCQNPNCMQKWFVFDNSRRSPTCPFCGTAYNSPLPVLNFYTKPAKKYQLNNRRLMVYNGTRLHLWHTDDKVAYNEGLTNEQREPIAAFQFHQGRWYLRNLRAKGLQTLADGNEVPIGGFFELQDNMQIRLGGANANMAHVQIVNR